MRTLGIRESGSRKTLALFAVAVVLAACQSQPPKISIEAARAELSAAIVGEAMVTMDIRNAGGPDVLSGVRTDVPGAKVSLHVMQGQRMLEADTMEVPAKGSLVLVMGGSHIMIENLPKTVKKDSRFNLTLIFQKSGEKTIPLTLLAPTMPMDMGHHM